MSSPLLTSFGSTEGDAVRRTAARGCAGGMHLESDAGSDGSKQLIGPVVTQPRRRRATSRSVTIRRSCRESIRRRSTPRSDIVTAAMKVFARDPRVVSIDSDLATTSGLEAGVAAVDQRRALNVGVAEANMMLIGEAFAALGCNTWVSTFCPFFDWKVLRRIAVGHQERLEAIARRTAGSARATARSHVPRHGREFRNPHQRRDAHGQRRQYWSSMPSAS